MSFVSLAFISFFAVVMAGLWLAPSAWARQLLLLLASVWFYAFSRPAYLLVLAAPIFIDYFGAIRVEAARDRAIRKRWLAICVTSNLLLLAYFKYANFFLKNISIFSSYPPKHLDIILPLGISFFTFKSLSYVIDVYRGELPACGSLWRYSLFITYFPDLIAGPIIRASAFLPQMNRSLRPSWQRTVEGCQMILLGLTKKLLIADQMAIFVDPVFASADDFSPFTVWSAVIAYSLQIYCDFSGYSDMAIGVSKIIGIDLPENFNMPYLAVSPIDFWRRWHITLSHWLRDYLFFSLPIDRAKPWKNYRNVAMTFLLSGLWHGAGWTFVCWGALHGLALAANHWWSARGARFTPSTSMSGRFCCWLGTYLFVCLTWVFFRAENLTAAFVILRKMAGIASGGVAWFYSPLLLVLPIVIVAHVIGIIAAPAAIPVTGAEAPWIASVYREVHESFRVYSDPLSGIYVMLRRGFVGAFIATAWALVVLLFGSAGANPFVYFEF
jgi:alginate O-acetyltransferase complex protein AlgI